MPSTILTVGTRPSVTSVPWTTNGNTLPERGGQSALFGAVQWNWPKVVQYLIGHGAKVDIVDDMGVSPLDAASGKGSDDNRKSDEVAKMLQASIGK